MELADNKKSKSEVVKIEKEDFKEQLEDKDIMQIDSSFQFKPAKIQKKQMQKSKFAEMYQSDDDEEIDYWD